MAGNTIRHTQKLIQSLRPGEWDTLQSFLMAFHQKYGDYTPKTLVMAQLLREKKPYSEEKLRALVCPDASDNTFRMLLTRLRDKVFECLTLDVNINRQDAYSRHYQVRMQGRKWLSQAEILHGRGLEDQALFLYDRTIRMAKRYETFGILTEALMLKREMLVSRGYFDQSAELAKDEMDYRDRSEAIFNATWQYYNMATQGHFSPGNPINKTDFETALRILELDCTKQNNATLHYWYYRLRLFYLEHTQQYHEALMLSDTFLLHIKKHPSVRMDRRLGVAYLYKAQFSLIFEEYTQAARFIKKALSLFQKGAFNYLQTLDLYAKIQVATGAYSDALKTVQKCIRSTAEKSGGNLRPQRQYYLAGVYFLLGKRHFCGHQLDHTLKLDKDKNGWNLHVRLLQIMNQYRPESDNDICLNTCKNLFAFVRGWRIKMPIPERFQTIMKVLKVLYKDGFDFSRNINKCLPHIVLLQMKTGPTAWHPFASEFVRFDTWYLSLISDQLKRKHGLHVQDQNNPTFSDVS